MQFNFANLNAVDYPLIDVWCTTKHILAFDPGMDRAKTGWTQFEIQKVKFKKDQSSGDLSPSIVISIWQSYSEHPPRLVVKKILLIATHILQNFVLMFLEHLFAGINPACRSYAKPEPPIYFL